MEAIRPTAPVEEARISLVVVEPGASDLTAPTVAKKIAARMMDSRRSRSTSRSSATVAKHKGSAYQPNQTPASALSPTTIPLVTVRHPNERPELLQFGVRDTIHIHEFIHRLERAILLPIGNDPTGKHISDSG